MTEIMTNEMIDQTDDLLGKYLTFNIADAVYGVELLHVIEIIQIQGITYVPFLPDYLKGIINLRGGVVPVIDVRLKLNLEEKEYDEKTCIIIIDIDDMHVGMIADSVSEVVTLSPSELAAPPKMEGSTRSNYLKSVANVDGKIILNMDCEKFFIGDIA